MAVVAYHSLLASTAFVQKPPHFVEAIFGRGFLGVDFFFVLSGFIIMHTHVNDAPTSKQAVSYIKKRARRIYVPYLPVSVVLIILYTALPSISLGNRDWGVFTSLTLIPSSRPAALSVAWTLIYEVMFYAIFCSSYFFRHFALFVAAWVASIVAALLVGLTIDIPLIRVFLSPLNLEFVAGMASAYACTRISARWCPVLIGVGLVGAATFFLALEPQPYRVLFGLALAPIVTGAVLLESQNPPLALGWLVTLGNASYAIYLVHNPIVSVVARASMSLHSWALTMMLCAIAGTLAGVAYHFRVEKPGMRMTFKAEHILSGVFQTAFKFAIRPKPVP